MSSSQASQATEAIDTPITTAQFLKNWVAGRYRNLIDWGSTNAGTRVTAELKLFDKKGKPTGNWQPVSLLITDITARTTTLPTTGNIVQPLVASFGKSPATQLFSGPPAGKTNWTRIVIQNATVPIPGPVVELVSDSASTAGSTMVIVGAPYVPYSNALVAIYPYVTLDNFGSSIWAIAAATSTSTATVAAVAYA